MSVDINWETLTGGSDGRQLAEVIKEFIHDRFQQISFPKLIRSVQVHAFDFGTVAPDITLKDVCEPLPDFYDSLEDSDGNENLPQHLTPTVNNRSTLPAIHRQPRSKEHSRRPSELELLDQAASPTLTRGAILGSTSNFGYFHLPGFSGTNTPLAAVAGAHFQNGMQGFDPQTPPSQPPERGSPSSSASPASRPVSRDHTATVESTPTLMEAFEEPLPRISEQQQQPEIERSAEDLQVVFHVTYAGDVRLCMTAEVFLDYPMPSFVGIPLKLNITGLTFNGVGILAYIKKRAHLCFLSPEDAEALVGSESATVLSPSEEQTPDHPANNTPSKVGALLEEIKIESEMGETGDGKQVLKNVGKIEKFILEQVQRIFEDEFVYPSFWTFLV